VLAAVAIFGDDEGMGRGLLVAVALMVGGCSALLDFDGTITDAALDAEVGGDGGDGGDGAIDASVVVDAAPLVDGPVAPPADDGGAGRITCGTVQCIVGLELCCVTTSTATCKPLGLGCSGGVEVRCDGTEDCGRDVCCGIMPAGPLECRAYGAGTDRCSGNFANDRVVICNEARDCPAERPICQSCPVGLPLTAKYCTATVTTNCTVL